MSVENKMNIISTYLKYLYEEEDDFLSVYLRGDFELFYAIVKDDAPIPINDPEALPRRFATWVEEYDGDLERVITEKFIEERVFMGDGRWNNERDIGVRWETEDFNYGQEDDGSCSYFMTFIQSDDRFPDEISYYTRDKLYEVYRFLKDWVVENGATGIMDILELHYVIPR